MSPKNECLIWKLFGLYPLKNPLSHHHHHPHPHRHGNEVLSGQDGAGDVPPTLWPIRRHGSQDRVPALKTLSSTVNGWRRDRHIQIACYHIGGWWMNKQRLALIITFSAFSTRTLAVFSLSGLIAGRLGILRRNLPSTAGATVDCNTETYRLIRFQYKVRAPVCTCVYLYVQMSIHSPGICCIVTFI